ncbi:MAG: dihydropyrimidinase [Acidobacteriia bacterium]|nr:dihydropyrimidinase [Methyloceanibacter sp.]MCL6491110.1 dihydropyrimidinase [Terriglobia bacterium]
MPTTLIKNGRIVTAVDDYRADILIKDGRIHTIGRDLSVGAEVAVHDAAGLLVLPGGVDVHTHLDWEFGPSRTVDTFATGTKAAAFGGTTTIVDFCNQSKGESPLKGLEDWHRRRASAAVDVGAHMILLDVNAQTLADMKILIEREGVSSFKLFMAYPGVLMVDDGALFQAMRVAGANGAMICVHAENGAVIQVLVQEAVAAGHTSPKYHMLTRPSLMEGEATHRAIRLAELADTPLYIVHLSAAEALAAVTEARDRGIHVHAETCPHYLFLTDKEYDRPEFEGAKFVMTPPLRDAHHQHALWRGLKTNDLQVISTDHCPFCFNEQPYGLKYSKQLGREDFSKIPNGAPGIETRLPLVYDGGVAKGRLSLNRFVDITATTPAKLFGLFPRKGTIAVGSDADLVLFDPNERWTIRAAEHHSRVDYSLFEGREVTGRVKKVFLRGDLIVDGDRWLGRDGQGEFLHRPSSGRL